MNVQNRSKRPILALSMLLLVAAALLVSGAGASPVRGGSADALDCTFRGPGYPALTPTSRPGSLYAVFIRRQLTCDQARTIARRGTKTPNPGPLARFQLPDGWSCLSFAPARGGNGKALAGQCMRQSQLVSWLPICEQGRPCTKLVRR